MDWKKLGKKLLFPPVWLMAILAVLSAALLTAVFVKGWEEAPIAYGIYVLSFYTLGVLCLFFSLVLPKHYKRLKLSVYQNPFGNRYLTDRAFRTELSLYGALVINLLYVGINIWSWYWNHSWWFMVLAGYYVIMSVMRFLLVRYVRKNRIGSNLRGEWRRSRVCACVLLLINLSLSSAVLMILYQSKGYDYPGIMIYVMALYTFYSAVHSLVDMIRYRKLGSPIMSTAKVVSLSGALVSLLNLETAMFAQFGAEMSPEEQQLFIILTGAGVSVTVVSLSIWRIVKATKQIRRMNNGK